MIHGDRQQLFHQLTPERVLAAVEAGGLDCTGLCYPLNSFENRVYEVELRGGRRVVAKFYRPGRWNDQQILEEHRYLSDLEEAEVPVCSLLRFGDGSTLARTEGGGIRYCLSERRGGRAPDELDESLARRLGRLIARMHNIGAVEQASTRRPLDAEHYVHRQLSWLDRRTTLPQAFRARYFAAAESLAASATRLLSEAEALRIHADLHLGNVLLRDGLLTLLDFDDMTRGPAVQDLWLAIPGRDEESLRRREALLQGYEELRLFDRSSLRLIEPLRGLRMVRYAVWLARRWEDPAFKLGWPHFGTREFWENETRDLEEQVEATRRSLAVSEPEPEPAGPQVERAFELRPEDVLTNKDYFWDWEE